jgi:hypothetical protein
MRWSGRGAPLTRAFVFTHRTPRTTPSSSWVCATCRASRSDPTALLRRTRSYRPRPDIMPRPCSDHRVCKNTLKRLTFIDRLAPCSNNHRTTSVCPRSAAKCKGVMPWQFHGRQCSVVTYTPSRYSPGHLGSSPDWSLRQLYLAKRKDHLSKPLTRRVLRPC